jgi:hypothetical protein
MSLPWQDWSIDTDVYRELVDNLSDCIYNGNLVGINIECRLSFSWLQGSRSTAQVNVDVGRLDAVIAEDLQCSSDSMDKVGQGGRSGEAAKRRATSGHVSSISSNSALAQKAGSFVRSSWKELITLDRLAGDAYRQATEDAQLVYKSRLRDFMLVDNSLQRY